MAPFHRIAAYVPAGVAALGLGMASAVFRPRPGVPSFEFAICADQPGPLTTDLGVPVMVEQDLTLLPRADLVLVMPGAGLTEPPTPHVQAALREAHRRGKIVAAHCLGVFPLAATGLLDGNEATTHWQYADELAVRYPAVTVRAAALYVDQGPLVTGAGAAAGMDMYLHLVRREHGAAVANTIARLLLVPPHRDGGQQQYICAPVSAGDDGDRLSDVLYWAHSNLHRPLSVDELAARALMSRRSFIRHFKAATGTTPHAWITRLRIDRAEELLETTSLSIEQIAQSVGYGGAPVLRQQFALRRGVAPRDYRNTFTRN